ncbi:MAG TPA: ABC transporter ATP-binding protein, partial [Planctomycetota bacterium]|nr:ABC transporter ATP-binding protein [Planctomycetota bacterium]
IGLDPTQVGETRELIRDLGRTSTVLLSSHILSEVEKTCRRVLIMNRGRLVEQGTPEEIAGRLTRTGHVRVEAKGGDGRAMKDAFEKCPGVLRILWEDRGDLHRFFVEAKEGADVRPDLFRACVAGGWTLLELAQNRLSLEEAFTILTAPAPATSRREAAVS